MPIAVPRRTVIAALAVVIAARAAAAPESETPEALRWERLVAAIDAAGATAIARDTDGGRLAVGDARGVLLGVPGRIFARHLPGSAVADLVFRADGSLLAATDDGAFEVDPDGRATPLTLGPGAAARAVTRVAAVSGAVAAATQDGVFVSRSGRVWRRLAGALPSGAAQAVSLRSVAGGLEVWCVVAGELWRVALRDDVAPVASGDWRATGAERIALPSGVRDDRALDLSLGASAVVVAFPTALAVVERAPASTPGTSARPRWDVFRPQLPPGAAIRRLARAGGRFWLATDRGLLESASLRGPWRRSPPPTGTAAVAALAADAEGIYVAAREAVFVGRAAPAATAVGGAVQPPVASADPPIRQVHRAAIRYLGLERSRLEEMRRAVRRRGLWPVFTLRGTGAWNRDRGTDYDQAFLSGEMRFLTDRDYGRENDYDLQLTFTWDLRDLAHDPEVIDVSEETRDVIELRDDVLDEVTQLYYERRAVLAALAAAAVGSSPEVHRLRLRADELAAGIDAWTGGWFSERVPALAPW